MKSQAPASGRGSSGWPAAVLMHLSVAAVLLSACFGAWVAAEQASAVCALAWLAGAGLVYAGTYVLASRPGLWRPVALSGAIAFGAVAGYIILAYGQLHYPDKVSLVTRIGLAVGSWLPIAIPWIPFSNSAATLLEGLLPLAVGLACGRAAGTSVTSRRGAAIATATLGVALVLTASRGAWVAEIVVLVAALVLATVRRPWRTAVPLFAGLGLATAFLLTLAAAHSGPGTEAVTTLVARPDRLSLYGHSLTLARDFALSGIGLGDQFAMALSRHALLIEVPFLTYPHNLLLDVWLEMGLPGLAAWVALASAIVLAASVGEKARLGNGFRGAYLGVIAAFVHGVSDARQSVDGWTWLPLFLLTALVAARVARFDLRVPRAGALAWMAVPMAATVAVLGWVGPVGAAWRANQGGLLELEARTGQVTASAPAVVYREAIADAPEQATARRRLGILAMQAGRFEDARDHLEIALRADGGTWTTRKALGLACIWSGRLDEATALLASLEAPEVVSEIETWSWWRESRGEFTLALHAAQVVARLRPTAAADAHVSRLALRTAAPAAHD